MTESKKRHICVVCGYVYEGKQDFDDLPESWVCPICGVDKSFFKTEEA